MKDKKILIVYFSAVPFAKQFESAIEKTFGMKVVSKKMKFKCDAKHRKKQRNAECFLNFLEKVVFNSEYDFVLGITSKDIYEKDYLAVYGVSAIEKKSAVVSFFRLKDKDKKLFFSRVLKESIHELGHLFGLEHCNNMECVMRCSEGIGDCDFKSEKFCYVCGKELEMCLRKL